MRKMILALFMCAFLAAGAYAVKPNMLYQIMASEVIQDTETEPEAFPAETVRKEEKNISEAEEKNITDAGKWVNFERRIDQIAKDTAPDKPN
ncbi:MAG: hypothetical protein LUE86_08205 [Clostridiales bacterium]|nr:hypothetical protein [Clostridiales bacterium]